MHVLVVRQQSVTLRVVKVVVPNAEKGKYDRNVGLERRCAEMLVHPVRACLKSFEVFEAWKWTKDISPLQREAIKRQQRQKNV